MRQALAGDVVGSRGIRKLFRASNIWKEFLAYRYFWQIIRWELDLCSRAWHWFFLELFYGRVLEL